MSAAAKHLSFDEAIERIKDVNSCLQLIHVSEHVALSPKHTSNSVDLNCAIKTTLDAKLHKYSPKYGGLPVAYNNVTLLDSVGRTFSVSPMVYLNIMLDLIIFHPQVGSFVSGVVNKISFRHLGVLVHGIFNAAIEVPQKGRKNTVHEGQEIVFEVTEINTIHGLPIIKGKLSKEVSRDFNADEDMSKKLSSYHAPDSRVTELSNQNQEKSSESPIVHSNSQSTEQYLGKCDVEFELSENNHDLLAKKKKKKKKQDMSPVKGNGIDDMTSNDIDGKCITSENRSRHLVIGKSNLSALTETPESEKNSNCLSSLKSEKYEETEGNADVSYKDSSLQRKKKKKHYRSLEEIDASTSISIAPVYEEDFGKSVESHKKKRKHLVKSDPLKIEDSSLLNDVPAISKSHKKKKKKHSQPDAVNLPSLLEMATQEDALSQMPEAGSFVTVTSFNGKKKKKRQKSDNQRDFVKEAKLDDGEAGYKITRHKKKGINELFVKSEVTEEAVDCTVRKAKKHKHAESN